MAEREIVKEYTNGDFTVVWKPKLCIHSGVCVQTLPKVYHPKEKPWIKAENASIEELKSQISKCPSGALSYKIKKEKSAEVASSEVKVEALRNGPLLVHGKLKVSHSDGTTASKERTTAFCRCGASNNKPYCDGSHNKIEFKA